jgi:putative membrane protein
MRGVLTVAAVSGADLSTPLAIAALVGAYAVGVARIWARAGAGRVVHRWEVNAFAVGTLALVAVTVGPLDAAADRSLSAHMAQHVVLIGVVAPLLAVGQVVVALGGLAPQARSLEQNIRRELAGPRWPVWLAVALVVHAGTVVVWHVPALFDLATADDGWHALEHTTFVASGIAFWCVAASLRPAHRSGLSVVAVFVLTLLATAFGALMLLARQPWYPPYATAAGSTAAAVADQQLAGVIMWAYGGVLGIGAGLAVFASVLVSGERRDRRGPTYVVDPSAPLERTSR